MPARIPLYFDGGLRPAGMEIAVVLRGRADIVRDLGPGTSMTAEWLALLRAIETGLFEGLDRFVLRGDAAAVIAQATGQAPVPAVHRGHAARLAALVGEAGGLRMRHIGRSQNLAGIALARLHPR